MFEFQSPVNAAKFGILCQKMLYQRNVDCQTAHPLLVRMAINVGDVIFDGNDLMGSAINLASQVGRIADLGGIWVSGVVHNEIYNKVGECTFTDLGVRSMEMIRLPVQLYALELPGVSHAPARSRTAPKVQDSIDEALDETRIDDSIETPIETPIDTPIDAPIYAPISAPIDAPIEEALTNGTLSGGSTAQPHSRQTGVQTPRTTREFMAVIMRDREAAAISVSSAHRILVSGNFELATRVFMARVVRKKDFSAMVELLGMARNKTIPNQFREASGAVFESFFESLLSHKNMALAGQIFSEGFFGAEKRKVAFTIWRIAARKDVGAMRLLGCAVLELPNPTEEQVTDALSLLEQAARRQDAKAAMRLGYFYANPLILSQHKTEAFQWYWLARHLKDPTAQAELELLAKSIRKDEFSSIKIIADALVEEVEWNSRYNF
jgi:hypothetical protein